VQAGAAAVFDLAKARDAARQIAATEPDAIFVANDHMAFAVMDVLRFKLGLRVPEDISVVGYDDVAIAAWPAYDLTTVCQPAGAMVARTVDLLMARLSGACPPEQITIPGPLRIRGSARLPKD